jgi:RNA recognition motif-containing protein
VLHCYVVMIVSYFEMWPSIDALCNVCSFDAVGNVPYGTTEERLRSVFSVSSWFVWGLCHPGQCFNDCWCCLGQSVGRVVNVRVMADRGDPKKGYAFVEYDNPDTALSAIRNLAQVELDGRRVS